MGRFVVSRLFPYNRQGSCDRCSIPRAPPLITFFPVHPGPSASQISSSFYILVLSCWNAPPVSLTTLVSFSPFVHELPLTVPTALFSCPAILTDSPDHGHSDLHGSLLLIDQQSSLFTCNALRALARPSFLCPFFHSYPAIQAPSFALSGMFLFYSLSQL